MTPARKKMKKIAYLGPEGTHSHEACSTYYREGFEGYPCRTPREVFWSLAPDLLERCLALCPTEAADVVLGPSLGEDAVESSRRRIPSGSVLSAEAFAAHVRSESEATTAAAPLADGPTHESMAALSAAAMPMSKRAESVSMIFMATTPESVMVAGIERSTLPGPEVITIIWPSPTMMEKVAKESAAVRISPAPCPPV